MPNGWEVQIYAGHGATLSLVFERFMSTNGFTARERTPRVRRLLMNESVWEKSQRPPNRQIEKMNFRERQHVRSRAIRGYSVRRKMVHFLMSPA